MSWCKAVYDYPLLKFVQKCLGMGVGFSPQGRSKMHAGFRRDFIGKLDIGRWVIPCETLRTLRLCGEKIRCTNSLFRVAFYANAKLPQVTINGYMIMPAATVSFVPSSTNITLPMILFFL